MITDTRGDQMNAATELCPATDNSAPVQADPNQQPGSLRSLTLYSLTDELAQLISARVEMAEAKEDTTAVDAAISAYTAQLPQKVDATAHVLQTLESQIALAKVEEERLSDRRAFLEASRDRLKEYVLDVLSNLPKPKHGSRKLEGSTASLVLKPNGGLARLEIQDENLIPDECCIAEVRMPWRMWTEKRLTYLRGELECIKAKRLPSNEAIRKAMEAPCWACEGKGGDCASCGGSGKAGVPGARLLERGATLQIK